MVQPRSHFFSFNQIIMEFLLQRSNMLIETEQYVKVVRSSGATYPIFPSLSDPSQNRFTQTRDKWRKKMFHALPRRITEKFRRSKEINQRSFFCLDQRKKNESLSKRQIREGKAPFCDAEGQALRPCALTREKRKNDTPFCGISGHSLYLISLLWSSGFIFHSSFY